MRTALLALAMLVPQAATASLVPFPEGGYRLSLKPGEETVFNLLHLTCAANHITVRINDPAEEEHDVQAGRGAQGAAFADCRFSSGAVVRVKAGDENPLQPWGMCGAAPPQLLSVWIGRRKVISAKKYTEICGRPVLKSITADANGVTICTLSKADVDPSSDEIPLSGLPDKSICSRVAVKSAPIDKIEFAARGEPSSLTGTGLCAAMIDPKSNWRVRVPKSFARPDWQAVPPRDSNIDQAKLGFNATTMAGRTTQSAVFDLENSGHASTVYQHDEDNHWFAGSALAKDHPGILDVPFDAHDWDRSWKSGIYAYVYDRATVFFHRGRTYLLLEPENLLKEPRIVTLRDGTESEVCRLKRRRENF